MYKIWYSCVYVIYIICTCKHYIKYCLVLRTRRALLLWQVRCSVPIVVRMIFNGYEDESKFIVPRDSNHFPRQIRKKIVAIERSNKLAIVGIIRKRYVIMPKKNFICRSCRFSKWLSDLKFKVATRITPEVFRVKIKPWGKSNGVG